MLDRTLERLLTATARDVTYPAPPDLSARVLAATAMEPSAPRIPDSLSPLGRGVGRGAGARRAFAALVAAMLVLLALTLAVAPTRDAIARLFGVEGSKIEVLPTPRAGESPTPIAAGVVQTNGRGAPVALEDIEERAGFGPALPNVPDPRLGSSVVFYAGQPVVMHHYAAFDLWETRLRQEAGFGKGLPESATAEEVEVNGVPGVWLTGAPHYVYYYTQTGFVVADSQRLVERNTLVWRTDAFFYRMETDLPLEDALRIAETMP